MVLIITADHSRLMLSQCPPLFRDATFLRQIGRPLLLRLFERLRLLTEERYTLPNPRVDGPEYFDALASTFERNGDLPEVVRSALRDIEGVALSVSEPRLRADLQAEPSGVRCECLREAMESWLGRQAGDGLDSELPGRGEIEVGGIGAGLPVEVSGARCGTSSEGSEMAASAGLGYKVEAADCQEAETEVERSAPAPGEDNSWVRAPDSGDAALKEAVERLAKLPPSAYDGVRRREAGRLRLRVATLDAEVARARAGEGSGSTAAVRLPELEPWPEAVVNIGEVLEAVSARYAAYIALPPGASDGLALWTAHAHAVNAFAESPRLNLLSRTHGCGKTLALDVLATMVPKPLRAESVTSPVLFRVNDEQQPTLLLDELDTYLRFDEELRGLLNAGHKRGSRAYRCEGAGNVIRAFKAFGPAALAGIGELPVTLRDRSILIPMERAKPGQIQERFKERRTEIERTLGRKLARWAKDHFEELGGCEPVLPPSAYNRLGDNWRPLFAVAQVAGGEWPRRALAAFEHLAQSAAEPALSSSKLIADIRRVFAGRGADRLSSGELAELLCGLEGSEWLHGPGGGKPIDARSLAKELGRFGISPRAMRFGKARKRGYAREDFESPKSEV